MSVVKADANPVQPTASNLDANGVLADVLSGGNGGWDDTPSEETIADATDSTDWTDPVDDDVDAGADNEDPADDADVDAEATDGDETTEAAAKPDEKKDTEEIEVTDETGRRKIAIDYSDRKGIKRAYEQAAGARKLYARNRELRAELETAKPTLEAGAKAVERWNLLETEYSTRGMDAVIERITGRPAAEYYTTRQENERRLAAMSPAERALHERSQSTDKQVAEAQTIRAEAERIRAEALADREAADLEKVESLVHPEFDRVRMKGKMGDPAKEHRIDTMIWDYVQSELVRIAEKGVTPNRDLVRQTFSDAASLFSSAVEARASKQTAAALDNKKKQATKEAQSAVVRGERQLRQKVDSDADFSHTAGAAAFLASVAGGGRKRK